MVRTRVLVPVAALAALMLALMVAPARSAPTTLGIVGGQLFSRDGSLGHGDVPNPISGGLVATAKAISQRDALVNAAAASPLSAASWKQYGTAPLLNVGTNYQAQGAWPTGSGRITDLIANPAGTRLYAGVGLSGVYESTTAGKSWRLISGPVPNPTNGAVGYTTAGGGTVIDATGDYDGGYIGLGVWWTNNDGKTWTRSTGVPSKLLSSKVAVDPTNPSIVYVGTSRGLWRSTDAGRSFTNVHLPVGPTRTGGVNCGTDLTHPECALADWVSDVVVRPADGKDKGGEVLAAVGWERGVHATAKGWNNALGNGLYSSPTGKPGTFANLDASAHGFTAQSHIGRVSLGNAVGPLQNHDVVWAMVMDAQKENGGYPLVDPNPDVPAACGVAPCYTTELDNIYLSTDFGKTWTQKLPPAQSFGVSCGVTGTDLCGLIAAPVVGGYAPGIQARYNNYIRPDPTRADANGTPTRIIFGLEELWQIDLTDPTNTSPTGYVVPHTIGRYFGGDFCPETVTPGTVPSVNPPVCPGQDEAPTTTHPDQHRGLFVPDGSGGVTFYAGDDGGIYSQHVAKDAAFSNAGWGHGNNSDLNTTLQYNLAVSGDGVAYTGLQDNGEMRIEPSGRMVEVYGGDAFYSATEPKNSKVVYEEYTFGNMNVSVDGGHTWASINPGLTGSNFSTPFTMDPADPNHLVTGGEDIEETTSGPNTTVSLAAQQLGGLSADGLPSNTAATDWAVVEDLGSGNAATAIATRGKATYVGWCGPCYIPSTVSSDFHGGIATNVGGSAAPDRKSKNGWHLATATGLPQRYITSAVVDPSNPRTVFVTLADYDPTVEYRYPGALGDTPHMGHGHVFMSTDAGGHFTDISGNLPDTPADWITTRGNGLVVATNVGVFLNSTRAGMTWVPVGGSSLPITHETTVQVQPGNPNRLFLSTYGRGAWVYDFPAGTTVGASGGTRSPSSSGGGTLVKTGQSGWIAVVALAFVSAGLVLVRRRRRRLSG